MRNFWEKNVKIVSASRTPSPEPPFASSGWGLRPQTLALLLYPTITALSSLFLVLIAFYALKKTTNYSKCSAFASSAFAPIF